MSDFNHTHTFQGLELEFQPNEPFYYGLAPFRDVEGNFYYLPLLKVERVKPNPEPGEVWTLNISPPPTNKTPLRFVDSRGNLVNARGSVQWDPDLHDVEELHQNYTKVLNADGSHA